MKRLVIVISLTLFFAFIKLCIPVSAEDRKAGIDKQDIYNFTYGSVYGGKIADGLDVKNVRWGKHDDFERLVFDVYKWGGPTKPAGFVPNDYPGSFEIKFKDEFTLLLNLSGYRAFTASSPDLYSSEFLEVAELQKGEIGEESNFVFLIKLKRPAKLEVFELYSPARIVVDFKLTTQ